MDRSLEYSRGEVTKQTPSLVIVIRPRILETAAWSLAPKVTEVENEAGT